MAQLPDESYRPDALLAVSVWFEPEHAKGFRARLRSLEADGTMNDLGATSSRQKVSYMVAEWLESLDAG